MIIKGSWTPSRFGRMTGSTVHRKSQGYVIRINRLIKVLCMARLALCRGSFKTVGVTTKTIYGVMCPGKWKRSGIMVKCFVSITRRMTCQTRSAVVSISCNTIMLFLCFSTYVTGDTGEFTEVSWCRVAIHTCGPFSFMCSAVDREILSVMIKGGRCP